MYSANIKFLHSFHLDLSLHLSVWAIRTMILPLKIFFFFKTSLFVLKPSSTTRTYSKMCSLPLPVYTGKHIQEWLLLESLPSHFFATLKWTFLNSFSHSFICWSILGLEFKFCFKTLTIPFCLQKELNASNIWLGQELCSHPNFTVFPTQTATQDTRSQHYCFLLTAWLIAWQRNQPKISSCMLNMKIFFFSNMIVEEKNVFVLKSLHYWEKLHCFVFPFFNAHFQCQNYYSFGDESPVF